MRLTGNLVPRPRSAHAGFSLVELMITLVLLAIVVAVIATVMISSQRSKADTEGRVEATQSARAISDIITADLRTAGYGADTDAVPAQTPFAYVDSTEIILCANLNATKPDSALADTNTANKMFPRALNPLATPLPPKITGAYLPSMMYSTGAEMIRYTLDLNNDGVVDAGDQAVPLAQEAQRTANPNDFVIARATYGVIPDGSNGGSMEKVGIIRGPGAGIPPMYTVYLGTNPLPWDWHNGAIPASRLREISRITLQITTEARRARKDGTYPRATLTTEVNSLRNSPGATGTLYSVSGYVFDDQNHNTTRDAGEPGVANAVIRLGTAAVVQSSATGYFAIAGAPAQYIVRQEPPEGYGAFAADSFAVDFVTQPVDVTHNFADTARAGGWVSDTCFVDNNLDGVFNSGDDRLDGVAITAGGTTKLSGSDGGVSFFLPVGSQTLSAVAPDSTIINSTNPTTVTVTNGSTQVLYTALSRSSTGKITGYVFLDVNKNGIKDAGEATGIPGAWVGVTKDAGATLLGYATSDASGYYEVTVANNMPAATAPYAVTVIPPAGNYPTGSTSLSPVWVAASAVLTGKDFGMSNYTTITLTADRVLCLTSANLLEKDWTGSDSQWDTKGAWDQDLVLGSEYVSAPNISVWFNMMPASPLFTVPSGTTGYKRDAQSAALSIAAGPIDNVVPTQREDIVSGLARKPSGNIAVWLNQNSPTANLGYVGNPATGMATTLYQTNDAGDVNQVLLNDCAGGTPLDLIVGTKTSTNVGTIEVWTGSGTGTFTRDEIYPPNGSMGPLGEVKALMLLDVNNDGNKDLIVGTKTGDGQGKLKILRFNSRTGGNRYVQANSYDVVGEVTSLTSAYVDGDLIPDIIVGTRISSVSGNVQWWRGNGSSSFSHVQDFTAPGPVLSLASADMGGGSKNDIIYGFRDNETAFTGGVRILYLDLNILPPDDVDPAGGNLNYMSPSLCVANFNYRINNTTPGPYYPDLAVAQKPTSSTGNLIVFIR